MHLQVSGTPVSDDPLRSIAELASRLGAAALAAEAGSLADRLAAGRLYLACVGQFKRGKSTLLNALVGEPVLPVGVQPVTSIVTTVRYGAAAARRGRLPRRPHAGRARRARSSAT